MALDACYLRSLGPAAFPAVDRLLEGRDLTDPAMADIASWRALDERWYRDDMLNWRAWSLRDWRLLSYLDAPPAIGTNPLTPHP